MALLRELGFLPLNARDDFNVLYRFFSRQEFTDEYLAEELELTQVYLEPPQEEAVRRLMLERSPQGGGLLQAGAVQLQQQRQVLRGPPLRHPPLLPSDLGVLPAAEGRGD